jgi:hypothetical protein
VVRLRKAYARVQIRIDEGTVRKAYHVDIDQEYDKARRLHELSNPERYAFGKPTALLLEESSIEFELVRPSMTLYRMIDSVASGDIDIGRLLAVVGLCGEALGAVHGALSVEGPRIWAPPESFAAALERYGCSGSGDDVDRSLYAFGHGDFGFSNILVSDVVGGGQYITVIDSSGNGYTSTGVFSFEPVYVDSGLFVSGLLGRVSLQSQHVAREWGSRLMERFLQSYEASTSLRLDRRMLISYACASIRAYRGNYFGKVGALPRRTILWWLERQIRGRHAS